MLRAPPGKKLFLNNEKTLTSCERPRFQRPPPSPRQLGFFPIHGLMWAPTSLRQKTPSLSLSKSILSLFVADVRHPHFPRERWICLFLYLFPWPRRLRLVAAQTRAGVIGEDGEDSTSRRCPPVERDSARAGCVTRDVSESYRCSGW